MLLLLLSPTTHLPNATALTGKFCVQRWHIPALSYTQCSIQLYNSRLYVLLLSLVKEFIRGDGVLASAYLRGITRAGFGTGIALSVPVDLPF